MELGEIRKKIDAVDGEIIALLAGRAELVRAAGSLKKDEEGVRNPKRVEQVIGKIREKAISAGLDAPMAEEIYRAIIGCFIRQELQQFAGQKREQAADDAGTTIRKAGEPDAAAITAVFNHYVENSFAAYPEQPVDTTFYGLMKNIVYGGAFFVAEKSGRFAGFAFLKRYHANPAFDRVAEVGYFLLPEHTRQGLGGRILKLLENEARTLGIDTLLANISSLNPASLAFHEKNGFRERGRFRRISRKFGRDVDIVWMQKFI